MENRDDFISYLKRKGKKPHVISTLVKSVELFEKFLLENSSITILEARKNDLNKFATTNKDNESKLKQLLRGICLYYTFVSNNEMANLAAELREKEISKTRSIFKIENFRGINQEHIARLKKIGIVNVNQLIGRGKTSNERKALSHETGVPLESILEYVKLSDLSRIGAVKSIRARLYYDAGVDTIDKLASWEPEELREMLVNFVKKTGFDGIAPLPKEARSAVENALTTERIVVY